MGALWQAWEEGREWSLAAVEEECGDEGGITAEELAPLPAAAFNLESAWHEGGAVDQVALHPLVAD